MNSNLVLLMLVGPTTVSGYYYLSPFASNPTYDLLYTQTFSDERYVEPAPSARWSVSSDAYQLKVRLPDLEPKTVSAALAAEGTKIEIRGERKIEGCSCTPSMVKEIQLPYRPRAEDIDVSMKDDILSLKLERHAKTEAPTQLAVKTEETKEPDTRTLRFVPHASATEGVASSPSSVEEQEKSLTDKFRTVALAAVAVQPDSSKEAAASKAEATAVANDSATVASQSTNVN